MKLYTVIPFTRRQVGTIPKGHTFPPRYDLAPMNHAAACNFMEACRTGTTDYRLHPWPDDVPHPKPPMLAASYRDTLKAVNE